MNKYLLEECHFKLKFIGIYQIIGGTIGIGLTVWLVTMLKPMPLAIVFIICVSIGLFLYSIACGIGLCLRRKAAINLSIILQLLQVLSFTFFSYSLKFLSGLGVLLIFGFKNNFNFKVELGYPIVRFTYLIDPSEKILNINIAAILITFFLFKLKRQLSRGIML